jgi:hypothetical protein
MAVDLAHLPTRHSGAPLFWAVFAEPDIKKPGDKRRESITIGMFRPSPVWVLHILAFAKLA